MPDPVLLLCLLLPVALLLFLNLRTFRRVVYPHQLLKAEGRRARTAFLIGSFRTHSDIIFDALIAVFLAFALSSALPVCERRAVVLDASASMLRGSPGKRPVDKALERLASDPAFKGARAFVLSADPKGGGSGLYPLKGILGKAGPAVAAAELRQRLPFLGLDLAGLSPLPRHGYTKVSLLTDRAQVRAKGFELIELAPNEEGLPAYPSRLGYDAGTKAYKAYFAARLEPEEMEVTRFSPPEGRFLPLQPGAMDVETFKGGWAFSFSSPGIYRLGMRRARGEMPEAIAFRFLDATRPGEGMGGFSSLMVKVFPLLVPAPRPRVLLFDLAQDGGMPKELGRMARDTKARGGFVLGTGVEARSLGLYLDPGLTGARPILAAYPAAASSRSLGADELFYLGPEALANEDLPLAYDGALEASLPPAFLTYLPRGGKDMKTIQDVLLTEDAAGLLPVNPPPSEYFLTEPGRDFSLAPPQRQLWPWAILMAFAAAGKLLAHQRFSGRARSAPRA